MYATIPNAQPRNKLLMFSVTEESFDFPSKRACLNYGRDFQMQYCTVS
jgi:hypothetical protein